MTDDMSHNSLVNKLLAKLTRRPVFLNNQQTGVGGSFDASQFLLKTKLDADVEMVGSAMDGLQVGKIFDVGDVDILVFSKNVHIDENDEKKFQYLPQDPSFLQIPTDDVGTKLPGLAKENLLSAHDLRNMRSPFFTYQATATFQTTGYSITPIFKASSPTKCAVTVSMPYSDCANDGTADSARLASNRIWEAEHIVLSYLLHSQFGNEIDFVREILYQDTTVEHDLTQALKTTYGLLKKDIRNNLYGLLDAVYFRTEEIRDLLHQTNVNKDHPVVKKAITCTPHGSLSQDIVPAIRCTGWPQPARNWITRTRMWPTPDRLQQIVGLGYQLVAKSPVQSPDQEHDFLLSFSSNERKLIEFLPEEAKTAYKLLKHFYKCITEDVPDEKKFKTFHLKTALLWVAEQMDPTAWGQDGNYLGDILRIVDFLSNSLDNRYLPGYFVPESNLICHFDQSVIRSMQDTLHFISSSPEACVYVAIEKEWNLMKQTTPEDSFVQLSDPNYLNQFTWQELIKFSSVAMAKMDDYPVFEMMDNLDKLRSDEFYRRFIPGLFAVDRPGTQDLKSSTKPAISGQQVNHAWQFLRLLSKMDIDPFNIIRQEVPPELYEDEEVIYPPNFLDQYPIYDQVIDLTVGDHVNAVLFQRLKYYGNVFHVICEELLGRMQQADTMYANEDVNFVMEFLARLRNEMGCTSDEIQDPRSKTTIFTDFLSYGPPVPTPTSSVSYVYEVLFLQT